MSPSAGRAGHRGVFFRTDPVWPCPGEPTPSRRKPVPGRRHRRASRHRPTWTSAACAGKRVGRRRRWVGAPRRGAGASCGLRPRPWRRRCRGTPCPGPYRGRSRGPATTRRVFRDKADPYDQARFAGCACRRSGGSSSSPAGPRWRSGLPGAITASITLSWSRPSFGSPIDPVEAHGNHGTGEPRFATRRALRAIPPGRDWPITCRLPERSCGRSRSSAGSRRNSAA